MKRIRICRIIFLVLAIIFAICITGQIFLAGMASFISPLNWMKHVTFVHLFGFNIPIFMLVFAYFGGLPRLVYWQLFGVLVAVFFMYFSANIVAVLPWVSAMHPLIAIILFILACRIVIGIWRLIFEKANQKEVKG